MARVSQHSARRRHLTCMMRRLTSWLLSSVFVLAVVAALVGTVFAIVREPEVAGLIAAFAVVLGLVLGWWLDELWPMGPIIGVVLALLFLGSYALHLLGFAHADLVAIIALGLVVLTLFRALIASGKADPYDE